MNKNYSFTKTSLISGFQCEKKLWFELHKKIKTGEKALFEAGNRFNDIVRKHYGQGLDLSKEFNYKKVIEQTQQAIESNNLQVIYEGGLQYQDTFIRSDVLIKNQDTWTMLEAKGSTSVKDINFLDVAIQSYVAKNAGLKIQTFKLIHINKEFIYQGDENYSDLIVEQDITEEVLNKESEIKDLIEKFKPLIKGNCPDIKVGPQCKNPYPCHYLDRCQPPETDIKNVSYTILPYHGKKIESYCQEHEIEKLKDVPRELLQSSRKI